MPGVSVSCRASFRIGVARSVAPMRRTLGTIKMWDEKTAFGQMMIGDDFARAARHLVKLYESDYSTAFCLCHVLEMYLKSYLLLKGEAARSLLRHDLNNLLNR